MSPSSFRVEGLDERYSDGRSHKCARSNRAGLLNLSIAKPLPALRYVNALMALPHR